MSLKPHTLVCFSADVFMCQQGLTGNGLSYWNLRLLSKGKLIDAFHWDNTELPLLRYKEKDGILVFGRWTTECEQRLQVLQSHIISSFAANDNSYDTNLPQQLEFDFGEEDQPTKKG